MNYLWRIKAKKIRNDFEAGLKNIESLKKGLVTVRLNSRLSVAIKPIQPIFFSGPGVPPSRLSTHSERVNTF